MYERMLDKDSRPDTAQIAAWVGKEGWTRLELLEAELAARYDLRKELRFPFGNHYGWGYKYSHRSFHLCYAFPERGAFTVMVQIGDGQVPVLEKLLQDLPPEAAEKWSQRYPCGERGGWIRYRILKDADLQCAVRMIEAKKAPTKQR